MLRLKTRYYKDKTTLFASPRAGEASERSEPGEGFPTDPCLRCRLTQAPSPAFPASHEKRPLPHGHSYGHIFSTGQSRRFILKTHWKHSALPAPRLRVGLCSPAALRRKKNRGFSRFLRPFRAVLCSPTRERGVMERSAQTTLTAA
jgi:hypothetical protein